MNNRNFYKKKFNNTSAAVDFVNNHKDHIEVVNITSADKYSGEGYMLFFWCDKDVANLLNI